MAWQTDLAGIKPVSEWTQEDLLRFNRDFGWVLRGGDDGGRQFFSDGSEGGNLPALNEDGQFQFPVNNRSIFESQINPLGYAARADELATQAQALGLTPEQALQYIYGPGSQIIDAGPYGQLIDAGFSDPSQWRLPKMSGFGNNFLDNFADSGGLVKLMMAGVAAAGAAAAGGATAGEAGASSAINVGGLDGALGDAGSLWGDMFGLGEAGAAGAGTMGETFFPDILNTSELTDAQQWAQSLGGLNADGSINWAAIDASPTLQSMGAISGDFGAIPFGTSASGTGTILDQITTLMNGGSLPPGSSSLIKSLFGGATNSGGASNSGGVSDFLRGLLGGGSDVLSSTLAVAPSLAAINYARNQSPFDTSKLESIYSGLQGNQSAYLKSLTDPFDEQTAQGFGRLNQSLQDRGVSGSSFGNMDLTNFNTVRGRGRADILGTGMNNQLTLQSGIASKLIDAQAKERELKNNLYGSALYALAGGLRPQRTNVLG